MTTTALTLIDMDNNTNVIIYVENPSECPVELFDQVEPYAELSGMTYWEVNSGEYFTSSEL